jgi:hypothetical protein
MKNIQQRRGRIIRYYCFIFPAAMKNEANTWFKANLDPEGGERSIGDPLNVSGLIAEKTTHFLCSNSYLPEQVVLIESAIPRWELSGAIIEHLDVGVDREMFAAKHGFKLAWSGDVPVGGGGVVRGALNYVRNLFRRH